MKKNKQKYLKCYYEWIKTGMLPKERGLCKEFEFDRFATDLLEDMISPTEKNEIQLTRRGFDTIHWGSDAKDKQLGVFTPLRQNLVLLMACLNNEL